MPSLTDSLAALADYSHQIHTLAAANQAPSGRYTTAYLNSLYPNPVPVPGPSTRARPSSRSHSRPSHSRPDGGSVTSLIRDADENEKKLFRFVGETEVVGVGRVKRVEKRDEGRGGGSEFAGRAGEGERKERDEVEIMLKTALRLVDDYRPMPRARATIANLLETHHTQLERVAELELQIEEAAKTPAAPAPPPVSSSKSGIAAPSARKGPPESSAAAKMTFEDAVKAEEVALRAMEAQLVPLRAAQAAAASSSTAPAENVEHRSAFTASSILPTSPPASQPQAKSFSASTRTRTPAAQKITNSLVNGTTPRRARATPGPVEVLTEGFEFDRFSPLKFLGTPRARGKASASTRSALREVMGSPGARGANGEEEVMGRGIFGRRVTAGGAGPAGGVNGLGESTATVRGRSGSSSGSVAGEGGEGGEGEDVGGEEDQTIRFAPTSAAAQAAEEEGLGQGPVAEVKWAEEKPEMAKQQEPEGVLEGVQYRLPVIEQAVAKIREGLSEMLRQGSAAGSEAPETVEATISHLARLSRSDPSTPLSPSSHSTSTLSSAGSVIPGPPIPPITPQTILTAHLLLALLRAPDAAVSMSDLKDDLGALVRARGWEPAGAGGAGVAGAGGMVTKCIYHVVGKRVAKIDRKAGAKVMFAI